MVRKTFRITDEEGKIVGSSREPSSWEVDSGKINFRCLLSEHCQFYPGKTYVVESATYIFVVVLNYYNWRREEDKSFEFYLYCNITTIVCNNYLRLKIQRLRDFCT